MSTSTKERQVPHVLRKMNEDQQLELYRLVEKKAWVKASEVKKFSDEELGTIAKAEKKGGPKLKKKVEEIFYRRHHWNSLRWFLFGGNVDIPSLKSDPNRAYDPRDNPWVKMYVPGFAFTKDEHDEANPFKRLPDKDYLRLLAYAWTHENLLALPKSRQMLVTWLFCCIATHETAFRGAKRTALISKKYDDADAHIKERIRVVWDRLPSDRFWVPDYKYKSGELSCNYTDSLIQAMGEEAKGLRQYTYSWVFFDEAAFAEQTAAIVQAALPTIKGGGRFTLVSSANGEEVFHAICSENGRIPLPAGR